MTYDLYLLVLALIAFPIPILTALYILMFKRVVNSWEKFIGYPYREEIVRLGPNEIKELNVRGRVAIIVSGGDNWVDLSIDHGPFVKVFKIRLCRATSSIRVRNPSRVFGKSVIVRNAE